MSPSLDYLIRHVEGVDKTIRQSGDAIDFAVDGVAQSAVDPEFMTLLRAQVVRLHTEALALKALIGEMKEQNNARATA